MPVIAGRTKVVLMGDNTDPVNASASGMGGVVKGELGRMRGVDPTGSDAYNHLIMCVSLLGFPHTILIMMGADGGSLLHMTLQSKVNVLRQYALRVLFVPPWPAPTARSTVLWHQCVTVLIHLQAEYTRPRPHHRANVLGQLGKCGVT